MDRIPARANPTLFGTDPKEGIVAVELRGDERVQLYVRTPTGIVREDDRFEPFLLLEAPELLATWQGNARSEPLEGSWDYGTIALFSGWKALQDAVKHLGRTTGKTSGAAGAPYHLISDPIQQYLTLTGRTLYKGLRFEDILRLQIDIETTVSEGFEFPRPQREGDRITLISLSDSTGWETSLRGDRLSEPEMIAELNRIVAGRDPDVIEGHNVFNFDLPYLETRARRHRLKLGWGRDGSPARSRSSRFTVAERIINYQRYDVQGRQLVDTLFLVQLYDVGNRELESFGLKSVARHLGVASPERTYVDAREIPSLSQTDMERLAAYGLDDVRETREISRILGQTHFYQTQIFPFSHQNTVLRGTATRIDALFLREYLRRRHSIPRPPTRQSFEGGYTDILREGVVSPVVHCDVQSLYPSIMLAFGIRPARDDLRVFPDLLGDLTSWRLEAKELRNTAGSPVDRSFFDVVQSTLKILINSFYGYLGFPQGHFADFEAAARVTAEGRRLIQKVLAALRQRGADPVEVDTDGVYFVPPNGVAGSGAEESFVEELSQILPPGIRLEMAGRYRAMLSYKVKNYVLLTYDGELRVKGSGLRSRGLEKFQRLFLEEMFRSILEGIPRRAGEAKERFLEELRHHRWTPDLFAKTETLRDSLPAYQEKRRRNSRNTSAAYELALASGRPFQPGDQVTYYVSGRGKNVRVFDAARFASQWDPAHPDENVEYYEAKLEHLFAKFAPYLDPETPNRVRGLLVPSRTRSESE